MIGETRALDGAMVGAIEIHAAVDDQNDRVDRRRNFRGRTIRAAMEAVERIGRPLGAYWSPR